MDDKPVDSLNMIPFIDIMLVLLTIVLMTSSFIASGRIPVQLPQAKAAETDKTPPRTIDIDAKGVVYFEDKAITPAELQSRLAGLAGDTPFLVRADRDVQLQRFIDVADVLKQLNFKRVAIQVEAAKR
ncbi:ExbD/TolR family protein [Humidesulfovibrio idahonensis]